MDVASIADLTLDECLEQVAKLFDSGAIAGRQIDGEAVLHYYRQSDRGYRLFHSQEGAMHVALDTPQGLGPAGYLGQVDLLAARLVSLKAEAVLEVGCGVGFNLRHLAQRLPDTAFVGVDLSADHVASACKEAAGLSNLSFEQGDFHHLRFDPGSFSAVCAVECLCQGTDWEATLTEIECVLRPGGRLIVIDCFRNRSWGDCSPELQLATRLVEKTMAVSEFADLNAWLALAAASNLRLVENEDLSENISQNLARFYSLSRRFFKMPRGARAFLKAFPAQLLENAIAGLLMPFTVGSRMHSYRLLVLEKRVE